MVRTALSAVIVLLFVTQAGAALAQDRFGACDAKESERLTVATGWLKVCVAEAAAKLEPSRESAGDISYAAMSECIGYQQHIAAILTQCVPATAAVEIAGETDRARWAAVDVVVAIRAKRGR